MYRLISFFILVMKFVVLDVLMQTSSKENIDELHSSTNSEDWLSWTNNKVYEMKCAFILDIAKIYRSSWFFKVVIWANILSSWNQETIEFLNKVFDMRRIKRDNNCYISSIFNRLNIVRRQVVKNSFFVFLGKWKNSNFSHRLYSIRDSNKRTYLLASWFLC